MSDELGNIEETVDAALRQSLEGVAEAEQDGRRIRNHDPEKLANVYLRLKAAKSGGAFAGMRTRQRKGNGAV